VIGLPLKDKILSVGAFENETDSVLSAPANNPFVFIESMDSIRLLLNDIGMAIALSGGFSASIGDLRKL
jgi:hypothetical protein